MIKLSEVLDDAEVFNDGDWVESKDQDRGGDVRLTQLADIGIGFWVNKSARYMTLETAKRLRCTFLKQGDLLVARMPDPIGRCCIFPGDPKPSVTVVDVCVIRPNPVKVYGRFLMHILNSRESLNSIKRHVTGTTRQRIARSKLAKIEIPFPPLKEQKRIAKILDAADQLRCQRREALAQLDVFLQSTFLDLFGDPVTNPKGWEVVPLGTLGTLDRGVSKHRPRNEPALLGGDHPLIQTGEVANSEGYIRSYKHTYSDLGLKQSKMWPAGTLCITIAANIASTGILTFDACFPDSVVGFRSENDGRIQYVQGLFWFLKKIIEASAPQVAQKNINLKILRELPVPSPSGELQKRFAEIVDRVVVQKQRMQKQLSELDTLFASLQQRAFNGEL